VANKIQTTKDNKNPVNLRSPEEKLKNRFENSREAENPKSRKEKSKEEIIIETNISRNNYGTQKRSSLNKLGNRQENIKTQSREERKLANMEMLNNAQRDDLVSKQSIQNPQGPLISYNEIPLNSKYYEKKLAQKNRKRKD